MIGRCPRFIRVQARGCRDGKLVFNYLFCRTRRAVLKMFARSFRIKQVKGTKNVQQELFTSRKNGETDTKRVLDGLKMP